ncbi:hypothetical protein C8Q80DRAFT_1055307, partial [Daedaleopsis nitida]
RLIARGFSTIDDQYLQDLFVARACVISGYAIFVYELFAAIPDEVEYIWPTRWSTVKVIYILNRYGNLVFLTVGMLQNMGQWRDDAPSFCYRSTLAISLVQLASFSSVHILVLLRAWATWGRHIKILIVLIVLFIAYATVSGALTIYAVVSIGPHSYPFADVIGTCLTPVPCDPDCEIAFNYHRVIATNSVSRTSPQWVVFLPSMILEFAIFALTMVSLRQYRFDFSTARRSPIARVIARDGIIYFLVSVFNSVINMLLLPWRPHQSNLTAQRPLNMVANSFTLSVVIVAGQRLVLDLRKVSTSDELSTTRVGREVNRAIGALPHTSSRARSPSPLVFAD